MAQTTPTCPRSFDAFLQRMRFWGQRFLSNCGFLDGNFPLHDTPHAESTAMDHQMGVTVWRFVQASFYCIQLFDTLKVAHSSAVHGRTPPCTSPLASAFSRDPHGTGAAVVLRWVGHSANVWWSQKSWAWKTFRTGQGATAKHISNKPRN